VTAESVYIIRYFIAKSSLGLLILAGSTQAFSVNQFDSSDSREHGKITRLSLSSYGFSVQALEVLDKGNAWQDLYPQQFKRHYIRWNWESVEQARLRSGSYLEDEISTFLDYVAEGRYEKGLMTLGRCLHTVQDVFSHSNYCDMSEAEQNTFIRAVVYSEKMPDNTLITGSPLPDRFDRYHYTHQEHAKDSRNSPEGEHAFEIARQGAVKGGVELIELVRTRLQDRVGTDSAGTIWQKLVNYGN